MTHDYFLVCDSINKFLLPSIYKKAKIEKFVLSLPLKHFIKASGKKNIKESNKNTQKAAFLFLYCAFSQVPYVKLNSSLNIETGLKFNFSLAMSFIKPKAIFAFIQELLIENVFIMSLKETLKLKILSSSNKKVSCEIFFGAKYLPYLKPFLQKEFSTLNIRELYFKLNFILTSTITYNSQDSKSILLNMLYFWKLNI